MEMEAYTERITLWMRTSCWSFYSIDFMSLVLSLTPIPIPTPLPFSLEIFKLSYLGNLNTGDSLARGNFAVKDQVMALKWVQNNIGEFGGNKRKVTLYGTSYGSMMISVHLLSPMSKGKVLDSIKAFFNYWSKLYLKAVYYYRVVSSSHYANGLAAKC